MHTFDDDSGGFDGVERTHVRNVVGVEDFEWVSFGEPSVRVPLSVPLSQARVTLISTAGAHEAGKPPLGPGGHAALIPAGAEIELSHDGYDTERASSDPEVVYPVRTLQALTDAGVIGSVAPTVVSTMGFVPYGTRLFDRAVPAAVEQIHAEQSHLALLVPA
ncbi:MAG: glycine/sarcosine/betaine reductase selenoprotein B family protein [Actinomycetota bacterium]